jgi:hypothetical protein
MLEKYLAITEKAEIKNFYFIQIFLGFTRIFESVFHFGNFESVFPYFKERIFECFPF